MQHECELDDLWTRFEVAVLERHLSLSFHVANHILRAYYSG